MKKAQLTIFFLLGIVIAIAFGFLHYVSVSFGEDKLEKKVNSVYNDFLKALFSCPIFSSPKQKESALPP